MTRASFDSSIVLYLTLTMMFSASLVIGFSIAIEFGYSQTESGQIGTSNSSAQSGASENNSERIMAYNYTDPISGLSVIYPANWTASRTGDFRELFFLYSPLENFSDATPAIFRISGGQYTHNVSLPEFTNFTLTKLKESQQLLKQRNQTLDIKSSMDLTVGGHPGHRIVTSYRASPNDTLTVNTLNAWTTAGNKLYFITYRGEEQKFAQHLPEAERILESLKIVLP